MFLTRHKDIAGKLSRVRAFGVDRQPAERPTPGMYDVDMLGFNYRMNEIEAALGLEQLKRISGILRRRAENYKVLSEGLSKIDGISQLRSSHGDFRSSYYCLSALLDKDLSCRRPEIIKKLNANGIGTSVYYPRPVPLFSYYREKYGYKVGDFPQAQRISDSSIALPVGQHLDADDMCYIADSLRAAIKGMK
jgi:dTDP-4-amino-4,6-dideoxygalactose transaminase